MLSGQLLLDLVHDALLLAGALGVGGAAGSRASHAGVSLLPVGTAGGRGVLVVLLVSSGQFLPDLLLNALLPPPAHAVVLGLEITKEKDRVKQCLICRSDGSD